jgi:hypothetical protein
MALCVRDRWPRWQWVAWIYASIIFVGSFHLGWHYASDGMVSAIGIILIWYGVRSYLAFLERWEGRFATHLKRIFGKQEG